MKTNVVLWSLLLLATLSACDRESAPQASPAVTVRVADVTAATPGEPLPFAGVVRARQRAVITFQVSGHLQQRPVNVGDRVEKGQLLTSLHNPRLLPARDSAQARLNEAKAQERQANQDYQRGQQLRERGVLSEQDIEQLVTRLDAARAARHTATAALAEAEQLLQEAELHTPFAATVESVMAEPGEFLATGQPLLRLSSISGLEVEIGVPGFLRENLQPGDVLPVRPVMTFHSESLNGVITEVGAASARGESYPVVVALQDEGLDPGTSVEVGVPRSMPAETSAQWLELPALSVLRTAEGTAVYRIVDGRAQRITVEVMQLAGERVRVRANALQAGDRVVYAGITRLVPGDLVEILQ